MAEELKIPAPSLAGPSTLNELFAKGENYIAELEKARVMQKALAEKPAATGNGAGRKKRLKRAGDTLRDREPW